jgi:cytochrome c-type biogenesis protein CcmF
MQYTGEHLLPGQIGHFCVVLSFVASLFAMISYYFATKTRETPEATTWLRMGRFSFVVHGLAAFTVIGSLFYILVNKYYEYQYAWANVSDDLPTEYVFSAFWKEQQGSFMLWSFWHIILGVILMFRAKKWEAPVLTVISFAEVFIGSMVLGLFFGKQHFGVSPFELLRDTMDAPIFQTADYLSKIKGNGLNPLLQNYWMTIHPPTLFLGFASTIVPFAFAIAGLWTRDHKDWLKPTLHWSLFSAAILGLGILMGGAWAYEALSFGGYWAWDPVENMSLVPWITLVAGIHTNMIARNTGYSIKSTYFYYLISFVLILYSTYLTRSGILGDSSVHSFTEMGLGLQLVLFIGTFLVLGGWQFLSRYREIPDIQTEESAKSREFWMFIGSLVLFFSAVLIAGATSLPVWNKIMSYFNPSHIGAALKDPAAHHNRYQLWIAVFIGVLSGIAQWMRYSEKNWSAWVRKFGIHTGIALGGALILTWLNLQWINANAWQFWIMLFAAMFTIVANFDFLITMGRGNMKMAGAALSHVGFGLLALGILSTGLNKEWISSNSFAMDGLIEGFEKEDLQKNVLLLRDAPMPMQASLEATYIKDTVERQTRTFEVKFKKRDEKGNPTGEEFVLYPNVMYDRQFTKVVASNPSTKHYWDRDVFTQVSSLPKAELDPEYAKQQEDSLKFTDYEAFIGDTIFGKEHYFIIDGLTASTSRKDYTAKEGDITVAVKMRGYSLEDPKPHTAEPFILLRPGEGVVNADARMQSLAVRVRLPDKAGPAILAVENYKVKEGQIIDFNGNKIKFLGFDKNATHKNYEAANGDIAVAAKFEINTPDGKVVKGTPLYCIRGTHIMVIPDFLKEIGLHLRFESIDPKEQTIVVTVAQPSNKKMPIPLEIAENSARSDYIVMETILFPGINLVWAGSLMMLLGLAVSLIRRRFGKGNG